MFYRLAKFSMNIVLLLSCRASDPDPSIASGQDSEDKSDGV